MRKWTIGAVLSCVALFACPAPSESDGGTGGGAGGGAGGGGGGGATYQTPMSPAVKAFGHALLESGGKLYAAGVGQYADGGLGGGNLMLARFDSTGARDTSFGLEGVVLLDTGGDGGVPALPTNYDEARAVLIDGDKVLLAGTGRGPTTGPGGYSFILARFNLDGTADTTFGNNGLSVLTAGASNASVWNAVRKLPSGKYLVAGTIYNGATRANDFVVARYNTDGSIDATYTAGAGSGAIDDFGGDEYGMSLVLQGDKAVVGGGVAFTVARHLADGPLDLGFGTSGVYKGGAGSMYAMLARADGKLLLVGTHTTGTGNTAQNHLKLQLLSADGVAEPSFGIGGTQEIPLSAGVPRGAAIDGDGKLWVYLGIGLGEAKVARVNADGTLDTTFGDLGLAPAGAHLPLFQPLLDTSVNRLVLSGGRAWITDLTLISTSGGGTESVFFLGATP